MFDCSLPEMCGMVLPTADTDSYTADMYSVADEDLLELIVFLQNRPRTVSVPQVADALLEFGDVHSAVDYLAPHRQAALFDESHSESYGLAQAAEDLAVWRSEGMTVHSILDGSYPARLRDIHECPPVLFTYGPRSFDDLGVCVVGSRKASDRGLEVATSVATALAQSGRTVVSGLAAGIDAAAHTAALQEGGKTIAVIGTGMRKSYPAENRTLQKQIGEDGLLVSQFWPDAPPASWQFPVRNATMSGLGMATFVAEAGETSGARIQARKAVEHGRPVILSNIVVERCAWAQKMQEAPNVWVARGVAEVLEHVDRIFDANKRIAELLGTAAEGFASARAS